MMSASHEPRHPAVPCGCDDPGVGTALALNALAALGAIAGGGLLAFVRTRRDGWGWPHDPWRDGNAEGTVLLFFMFVGLGHLVVAVVGARCWRDWRRGWDTHGMARACGLCLAAATAHALGPLLVFGAACVAARLLPGPLVGPIRFPRVPLEGSTALVFEVLPVVALVATSRAWRRLGSGEHQTVA